MRYIFKQSLFLGFLLVSCEIKSVESQQNSQELSYYPNGNIKLKCDLKDSLRDGNCMEFYENGNIKYTGTYRDGLRISSHKEFYENDSGKVHYELYYETIDGAEKLSRSRIYNNDGEVTYSSKFVDKDLIIYAADSVLQSDSLKVVVKLVDHKYDFTRAYIGDVNQNLGILDKQSIVHFQGDNHSVLVAINAEDPGWNKLKGFIVDFAIETTSDSLYVGITGVEKGESTYFEHTYYVVPQSEI